MYNINHWSCTLTLEMQTLYDNDLRRKEVTSYKYIGHEICHDLSDEADIEAKVRLLYAKCNMLRQKCHFCSIIVTKIRRCSASHMFATANVNSCKRVIRKAIFSLMTSH